MLDAEQLARMIKNDESIGHRRDYCRLVLNTSVLLPDVSIPTETDEAYIQKIATLTCEDLGNLCVLDLYVLTWQLSFQVSVLRTGLVPYMRT